MPGRAVSLLILVALAANASAQAPLPRNNIDRDIDPALRRLIDRTPAYDNHAHPMLSPPADAADREFDALPVDNMEPQSDPLAWRADYPALADAWRALYGIALHAPLDASATRRLDAGTSHAVSPRQSIFTR